MFKKIRSKYSKTAGIALLVTAIWMASGSAGAVWADPEADKTAAHQTGRAKLPHPAFRLTSP